MLFQGLSRPLFDQQRVYDLAIVKRINWVFFESLGGGSVIPVGRLHRVGVRLSRAVTSLTSANVFLSGEHDPGVTRFGVLDGFLLVAFLTAFRPGKLTGRRVELRRTARDRRPLWCLRPFLRPASECDGKENEGDEALAPKNVFDSYNLHPIAGALSGALLG
jgi:hypothetical protein